VIDLWCFELIAHSFEEMEELFKKLGIDSSLALKFIECGYDPENDDDLKEFSVELSDEDRSRVGKAAGKTTGLRLPVLTCLV
jgi:hypothetical protein